MRKLFFLLFVSALSLPVTVSAQTSENILWRKTEGHQSRKNSITASWSVISLSERYNSSTPTWCGSFDLEYDRALPHNLSVSVIGIYSPLSDGNVNDGYIMTENFWFAGAKLNYNLPVVRNWLYLRIGLGVGAGFHDVTNYYLGGFQDPDDYVPTPIPTPGLKVKPHIIVDMYWVFRATQWLDLKLAPLIISPSQLIFGSKFNAPYNNYTYLYFNCFNLGATVRF